MVEEWCGVCVVWCGGGVIVVWCSVVYCGDGVVVVVWCGSVVCRGRISMHFFYWQIFQSMLIYTSIIFH